MITAISPIPTCCRWNWTRPFWPNAAPRSPNCPTPSAPAMSRRWASADYNAGQLTAEVEVFARFETLLTATAAALGKPEAELATQVANWTLSTAPGVLKALGDDR